MCACGCAGVSARGHARQLPALSPACPGPRCQDGWPQSHSPEARRWEPLEDTCSWPGMALSWMARPAALGLSKPGAEGEGEGAMRRGSHGTSRERSPLGSRSTASQHSTLGSDPRPRCIHWPTLLVVLSLRPCDFPARAAPRGGLGRQGSVCLIWGLVRLAPCSMGKDCPSVQAKASICKVKSDLEGCAPEHEPGPVQVGRRGVSHSRLTVLCSCVQAAPPLRKSHERTNPGGPPCE